MTRRYLAPKRASEQPRLELTPLIDVIFILVIFFAVTTTFVNERQGISVTLPTATAIEAPKQSVVISIDRQQRVYWNGTRLSESAIAQKVAAFVKQQPSQGIVLQADQQTPYNRVVFVLDAIRKAGCSNVMLEAQQQS
tara:strand:+ start:2575 stop:2988 length:414 start_codon:yes stop_codon:yes gene_type:complete